MNTRLNKLLEEDSQKRINKLFDEKVDLKASALDLKTLSNHLTTIEQFKEMSSNINILIQDKKKEEAKRQYQDKIAGVSIAFQFVGLLGKEKGNKKLLKVAESGVAFTQFFDSACQLMSAEAGLAALGPLGMAAAAGFTIFNLFKKKKQKQPKQPEQEDSLFNILIKNMIALSKQVLEHIDKRMDFLATADQLHEMRVENRELISHLSHQLYGMHGEMRDSFALIHENQKIIFQALHDGFCYLGNELNTIRNELDYNHTQLKNMLEMLNDRIRRSQRVIVETMEIQGLNKFETLFSKTDLLCEGQLKQNKEVEVEKVARQLYEFLKPNGTISSPVYTGGILLSDRDSKSDLHSVINTEALINNLPLTTMSNLGFLRKYAMHHLNFNIKTESEPFNSFLWIQALEKYINLFQSFPDYIPDEKSIYFNSIFSAAKNQKEVLQSFRSAAIFNAICDQYRGHVNELNQLVVNSFALQSQLLCSNQVRFKDKLTIPYIDFKSDYNDMLTRWMAILDCHGGLVPVKRHIVGENIAFNFDHDEDYPDHPKTLALFVLGECLGILNFERRLSFIPTKQAIGLDDVEGQLLVKLLINFDGGYYLIETYRYTTFAKAKPSEDAQKLKPHWDSKVLHEFIPGPSKAHMQNVIKQRITQTLQNYRITAVAEVLSGKYRDVFKSILEKIDANKNLLIHYARAAGLPSSLIQAINDRVWGSNHIVQEMQSYISDPQKTWSIAAINSNLSSIQQAILTKITSKNVCDFEDPSSAYIDFLLNQLIFLKNSSLKLPEAKKQEELPSGLDENELSNITEFAKELLNNQPLYKESLGGLDAKHVGQFIQSDSCRMQTEERNIVLLYEAKKRNMEYKLLTPAQIECRALEFKNGIVILNEIVTRDKSEGYINQLSSILEHYKNQTKPIYICINKGANHFVTLVVIPNDPSKS